MIDGLKNSIRRLIAALRDLRENSVSALVVHLLFWAAFSLAMAFVSSYNSNFPFSKHLINTLINVPAFLLFTYISIYGLIPWAVKKQRYILMVIALIAFAALCSVLKLLSTRFVFYEFFIPAPLMPEVWINSNYISVNFFLISMTAILFAGVKHAYEWPKLQKEKHELETKNMESELQLLKAQLNPHFLFNVLNNLYAMAIAENAPRTSNGIAQISDLLSNILYDFNRPEITLLEEIKLLESYINLQKLRYQDRLNLKFKYSGDVKTMRIAPLLLFTFVENCFKHGSSNDPGAPWMEIELTAARNKIEFRAVNSKVPQAGLPPKTGGMGLRNVRKRLDLIYPGSHTLDIQNAADRYTVHLTIFKRTSDENTLPDR